MNDRWIIKDWLRSKLLSLTTVLCICKKQWLISQTTCFTVEAGTMCVQMKWKHLVFERQVKLIIFKSLTSAELFTNKNLTLQTTCFIALAGLTYTWTVCTELLDTKARTNATNDNLVNVFFSLRFYFRDVTLNSPGELWIIYV